MCLVPLLRLAVPFPLLSWPTSLKCSEPEACRILGFKQEVSHKHV
jgi:hypothetical protein